MLTLYYIVYLAFLSSHYFKQDLLYLSIPKNIKRIQKNIPNYKQTKIKIESKVLVGL